jgi:hypothetical protein
LGDAAGDCASARWAGYPAHPRSGRPVQGGALEARPAEAARHLPACELEEQVGREQVEADPVDRLDFQCHTGVLVMVLSARLIVALRVLPPAEVLAQPADRRKVIRRRLKDLSWTLPRATRARNPKRRQRHAQSARHRILRRLTAKLRLGAPLWEPSRAKWQARSSVVRQGRSSAASSVLPLEVLPPRRLSRVRPLETSARRSRPPATTNSRSAEARQAHPDALSVDLPTIMAGVEANRTAAGGLHPATFATTAPTAAHRPSVGRGRADAPLGPEWTPRPR